MNDTLIAPHGGALVNLIAGGGRQGELKDSSRGWPSWDLTPRQVCDLELLMDGAAVDELGAIDDAAEVVLAAGVVFDPQAARARANPAPAIRVRARLINISVLLGCDRRSAGARRASARRTPSIG